MSRELELKLQRKNTKAFIEANPSSITLSRQTRVRTKAGGYENVLLPLGRGPQVMRIVTQSSAPAYAQQTDGQVRLAEYMLLGEWDADVAKDDTWTEPGPTGKPRIWVVGDVIRSNGYETYAPVTERGA